VQAGGIRFAYRGSDKTLRTPWSSCSIFAAESSLFKMENHRRRRDHKQEGLSTMTTSREIRLKSRIVGAPVADNFELATVSVPAPALGEVQVKNLWMSVDPYMRGRMVDRTSYDPHPPLGGATPAREIGEVAASNSTMYGWRPPFQLGEALQGGAVGEVVCVRGPRF